MALVFGKLLTIPLVLRTIDIMNGTCYFLYNFLQKRQFLHKVKWDDEGMFWEFGYCAPNFSAMHLKFSVKNVK